MRRWLIGVALLAVMVGCSAVPVAAQRRPQKLSEILNDIYWNTEERGALLIVAPQETPLRMLETGQDEQGKTLYTYPPFPARGSDGYRLPGLEEAFNRRLISCGTITVFAPATMTIMNTRLPAPNVLAELDSETKLHVFLATFNEGQWRKLGSSEGIGAGDLNPNQRALFLSLLPNPLRVEQTRPGGARTEESRVIVVPESHRLATRLSLQRQLVWDFPGTEHSPLRFMLAIAGSSKRPEPERSLPAEQRQYDPPKKTAYGAVLQDEVRAQQKPGHLDFGSSRLDFPVSLDAVGTVHELIRRVSEATRVELYCDPRFAALPVSVRGDSARAGDILRAIAWGVTGTYRRVGPAFVLTDDLTGFGTRYAVLADWLQIGETQFKQLYDELIIRMRKVPHHFIGWAHDDPFAPGEALQRRIAEQESRLLSLGSEEWWKPENRQFHVPVSDLSPVAQDVVKAQVARFEELRRKSPRQYSGKGIRFDVVMPRPSAVPNLIIPGLGKVSANALSQAGTIISWGLLEIHPPAIDPTTQEGRPKGLVDLPAAIPRRALILAPVSVEEAQQAVEAVRKRGFRELWLDVAPEQTGLLEAAIRAGKSHGVAVGAVVRILRTRGDTAQPRDMNLRGETSTQVAARYLREPDSHNPPFPDREKSPIDWHYAWTPNAENLNISAKRWGDWLRCDATTQRAIRERALRVARIPGLAGLILRDLTAPGYEPPLGYPYVRGRDVDGMGYTEEMRLAFLREYGADPVDLAPELNFSSSLFANFPHIPLPFFVAETKELTQRWVEYRVKTNQEFIIGLIRALRSDAPHLSLYHHGEPPAREYGGEPHWLISVDTAPDKQSLIVPTNGPLRTGRVPFPTLAESLFAILKDRVKVPMVVAVYKPTGVRDWEGSFLFQMQNALPKSPNVEWAGVVLDWSETSLEKSLSLLNLVTLPKEEPAPKSPLSKP